MHEGCSIGAQHRSQPWLEGAADTRLDVSNFGESNCVESCGKVATSTEEVDMAGTPQRDNAPVPNVRVLVDGIRSLLHAVETVRRTGQRADLPPDLVTACRDVVAAEERASIAPTDLGSAKGAQTKPLGQKWPALDDEAISSIPLRRLLWRVLVPGEQFSVSDVVERLADQGVDHDGSTVSNALGYWVNRNRLERVRKGHYFLPPGGSEAPPADTSNPGRSGTSSDREHGPGMTGREQEERSGTPSAKEGSRRAG